MWGELREWRRIVRDDKLAYIGKIYNHRSAKIADGTVFVIAGVSNVIRFEDHYMVSNEYLEVAKDTAYGFKLLFDEEIRD